MFERFTKEARQAVQRAADVEARGLGSRTVEAEHLLLSVSDVIGVERETLLDALKAETRVSLYVAGVALRPPAPAPVGLKPRFGASAKVALQRTLEIAVERGDRHIGARHLALGVLAADLGTVPRALAIAGLDRAALRAAL